MAELGPNALRLQVANALTLADELLELEIAEGRTDASASASMLKCELEVVLRHARELAGLNPDGGFDRVPVLPRVLPRDPAPATKKKGGAK